MKAIPLALICYTVSWYYTSSKNAIATQRLVSKFSNTSINVDSLNNNEHQNSEHFFPVMLVLTALQFVVGLCICWPLHHFILRSQGSENKTSILSPDAFSWKKKTGLVVGSLHFLGCICTNMGFAFGSASVVQIIKLLEPIETLLLTALFNVLIMHKSHGVAFTKVLSVLLIVGGTSMLLLQKADADLGYQVNLQSVSFALCSGFAMASRNVVKKMSSPTPSSKENTATGASRSWQHTAANGLSNYFSITAVAAVPATFCLILVEMNGSPEIKGSISMWMLNSVGWVGKEAIVFHGLYNISSISVLMSQISAQSHSILNVGKRICNVIYAAIAFQEPIGKKAIIGLSIAAIGGVLYTRGKNMASPSLPFRKILSSRFFLSLLLILGLTLIHLFIDFRAMNTLSIDMVLG